MKYLWIISLFLLEFNFVWGNDVMGVPVISKNIIRETKPVGSVGRLNCTVANLGTNKVIWSRLPKNDNENTQVISIGMDIKYQNPTESQGLRKYEIILSRSHVNEEMTYTLVIRRLVQDDDGIYQCSIMIQGDQEDTWPHRSGIMFVQRPPQILKAQSTSTVTAAVGERVMLECRADGRPEPNITWSRNRGTLKDPSDDTQVLRVKNATYVIHNVSAADRGMYRCMANNNVKPPAIYMVTLLVNFKPVIKPFRTYIGQAPDRNLRVEMACKVMGYPDPVVTWWRRLGDARWEQINDDYRHRIDKLYGHGPNLDVIGSWTALRILNIKMGDYGVYKCRGENVYGMTEENITLFMTTTCQGANCRLGYSVRNVGDVPASFCPLTILLITLLHPFLHL